MLEHGGDALRLVAGERPRRAGEELRVQGLARERGVGVALGAARRRGERGAVPEPHRDARPRVLLEAVRQRGIHDHHDLLHEAAHLGVAHGAVLERREVDAPGAERGGRAELHRELPLEGGGGVPVRQDVGDHAIHAHLDRCDVAGADAVPRAQLEEGVDRRVGERARGVGLHGDPGGQELPRAAEGVERGLESAGAAERGDVALRALERRLGRREPLARELRGQEPTARRVARVVGLGHRAEVLLEPGGVRGGDGERVARLGDVEPEQTRRGRGAAERADGGCRVPAPGVVLGVERAAERRGDLEADDVGQGDQAAVGRLGLAGGQRGREQRHARVAHEREVRVVEVVSVTGRAVGERRPAGRGREPRTDDRRERHPALGTRHLPHGARRGLGGAGEHHAERVERGQPRARDGLGRAILERRLDGELRQPGRGAHGGHDITSAVRGATTGTRFLSRRAFVARPSIGGL